MCEMATGYGWTSTPREVPYASLREVDTVCNAEHTSRNRSHLPMHRDFVLLFSCLGPRCAITLRLPQVICQEPRLYQLRQLVSQRQAGWSVWPKAW